MIHSDRVVRETTLGRGREDKTPTVTEQSGKVHIDRAVRESTK